MTAVTCPGCGASAPLPDEDLRRETYPCPACGRVLHTADVVGDAVVHAAGFLEALDAAVEGRGAAPTIGLDHEFGPPRPGSCLYCRAPIEIPMNLRIHSFTCPTCHRGQPVAAHLSDAERMKADLDRQVAQNEALKSARARGVGCPGCGAQVVLAGTAVQGVCARCGSTVSLAAVAGPDALARERLGAGVRSLRDRARSVQEVRDRRIQWLAGGIALAIAAVVLGGSACGGVVSAAAGLAAELLR